MFRKILLATIIAAVPMTAAVKVFAADATTAPTTQPERRHPLERIRQALEQLNLTEEQKEKVHKIMEAAKDKVEGILQAAKNGGDKDKAKEEVHAVIKDVIKDVSAVLTDEQKEKLRGILKDERGGAGDAGGAGGAGPNVRPRKPQ